MLSDVIGWFNEHPLVKFPTVITGLIGVGIFLAARYYEPKIEQEKLKYEQEKVTYDQEIADLNASLSNIERRVGGKTDVLNVDDILVDEDEAAELAEAKYYSAEGYYALDERADSEWKERETSEWELIVDSYGPGPAEQYRGELRDQLGPKVAAATVEAMKLRNIRAWRKDEPHRIALQGQEITLYPQVFVQRLTSAEIDEKFPAFETVHDRAGVLLAQQLFLQIGFQQQARATLESLQKRENTGYARYASTMESVRVNGKQVPKYFLTQEIVAIRTDDEELYLIKTALPRGEPRSADAGWVTRWFDAFHILTQ